MDPRKLRAFLAVAEELHFGRAARRLNISQPPLSLQVRALEEELGVPLFRRDRHSVALTEAGRVLVERARAILAQLDGARAAVQRAARGETGQISIGFITPVQYNVLPDLLREVRRRYPDVALTLREMMTDAQLAELTAGRLDVGLLTAPVSAPGLAEHRIWREGLVAVLPAAHPLARSRRPVEPGRLAGEPFILFPRAIAPALHDDILQLCRSAGFTLAVAQEAVQSQTIVSLVSAGLGVSILPESIRGLRRAGVAYRRLRAPGPVVDTVVAWRADRMSPVVENVLALARQVRA